jgi:undecaprenyl phosphate N,N'-diacetylbacillosamine 1-phosphate transferase
MNWRGKRAWVGSDPPCTYGRSGNSHSGREKVRRPNSGNCFVVQKADMSRAQRIFDLLGALAGLAVFAPAMTVIALAVLIDDGRPVFFRQERVGYRRRPFLILKFRSMRAGRVTRVGRLLRATGLDEVPQFINILHGHMSAVGPRPLTADDVARLGWNGRPFDFRWACRPGLTGLAQLVGVRPDEDALAMDRIHAAGWSPSLDCQLIAWSFAVNAFGKTRIRQWLRNHYTRTV